MGRQRRYDLDDLVAVWEIADRTGVAESTVYAWIRRHPDFPPVVDAFAHGIRVWYWPDVAKWLASRGRTVA